MEEDSQIIHLGSVLDIRKYLPQRYPFLFIDKIKSLVRGKSITTIKNVTYSDCFGNPITPYFPSEYVMEIFGQAAIILFYADRADDSSNIIPLLVGIVRFNICGLARPGDCVEAEVSFEKVFSNATIINGHAFVNGKEIASARFSAAFVKKPR